MYSERTPGQRRSVFDRPHKRRVRKWLLPALAVGAVAVGVTIGLMLPDSSIPAGRAVSDRPTPIYNPDPPRQKRQDTPNPVPAQQTPSAATGARTIAFGFCAGRSGNNCVIDGDTFILDGETIRLAGIDTPEIGGARCASERQRGEAAEQRLHEMLNSGPVRLVFAGNRDRDRYGRLLRDATVGGRSVSEWLIAEGYARRWEGRKLPWC